MRPRENGAQVARVLLMTAVFALSFPEVAAVSTCACTGLPYGHRDGGGGSSGGSEPTAGAYQDYHQGPWGTTAYVRVSWDHVSQYGIYYGVQPYHACGGTTTTCSGGDTCTGTCPAFGSDTEAYYYGGQDSFAQVSSSCGGRC
jgi:hypothetical protein